MAAETTGGDAVVSVLKAAGVEVVFGVISTHNIAIYDAISRRGGIRAIPTRNEAGAVNMADGYARASGRLGVAITSSGGGAGNAAGALVEAQTAGSPVLHITSQVESGSMDKGRGAGHEARDQLGMLRAISKAAFRPITGTTVPWTLQAAVEQALMAPRGVASVELPVDYQDGAVEPIDAPPLQLHRRPLAPEQVDRAARLLAGARRPVIWSGGGLIAAEGSEELRQLAEALGAAVLTSGSGRGALPEDHPLCIGYYAQSPPVRALLQSADVLLAVGTRFRGIETSNWQLPMPPAIVQIDVDPLAIGRSYPAATAILGDAKLALAALRAALPPETRLDPEYAAAIAAARAAARAALRATLGPYEQIADDLRAVLPHDAICVRDVTIAAATWGARLLETYQPRTSIHAVCAGIGQGFQMALGAKVARPDRVVVALVGDGGFMVNMGELATAVQEDLGIVILLFNDGGYGILRNIQDRTWGGRRLGVDLHTPDFVRLAEAFGLSSYRVSAAGGFRPALEAALEAGRPAVVELDMIAIGPPAVAFTGPPGVARALASSLS